jgi:DNA-binding NarL/FixJ family response regulator
VTWSPPTDEAAERLVKEGFGMHTKDVGTPFASRTKRIVLVADNSLIVDTLRVGLRKSGEFNLVGYADTRRTSAATIVRVQPDAVLLDDADQSERAIELIRELKLEGGDLPVIVLTLEMSPGWLDHVFTAGATGAISKATHPLALSTLLRATLNGHIVHKFVYARTVAGSHGEERDSHNLPLTGRELEILQLVAAGATNNDVARKLWVTEQTVKFHLRNIYRKLDVANRTEASHLAHVNGLVDGPSVLTVAS